MSKASPLGRKNSNYKLSRYINKVEKQRVSPHSKRKFLFPKVVMNDLCFLSLYESGSMINLTQSEDFK